MLPLQGALQTLLVTAGAAPEAQRSPQTTPPRELLTPEWGTEHIRRGHSGRLGGRGLSETGPPPGRAPRPQLEKGEARTTYTHSRRRRPHTACWERKRDRGRCRRPASGPPRPRRKRGLCPPPGHSLRGRGGKRAHLEAVAQPPRGLWRQGIMCLVALGSPGISDLPCLPGPPSSWEYLN